MLLYNLLLNLHSATIVAVKCYLLFCMYIAHIYLDQLVLITTEKESYFSSKVLLIHKNHKHLVKFFGKLFLLHDLTD